MKNNNKNIKLLTSQLIKLLIKYPIGFIELDSLFIVDGIDLHNFVFNPEYHLKLGA